MKRLLLAPLLLILAACQSNQINKSKLLFKEIIKWEGTSKEFIKVRKNYDEFTKLSSCSLSNPNDIKLSSINYEIDILPVTYNDGSTEFRLGNSKIQVVPKRSGFDSPIFSWKLKYSEWSKHDKLFMRKKYPAMNDDIYDLKQIKKAVKVHLKCKKDIGKLARSVDFAEKALAKGDSLDPNSIHKTKIEIVDGYQVTSKIEFDEKGNPIANKINNPVKAKPIEETKKIINSEFPDILSASQIASLKTTLQCREEFDGPYTDKQVSSVLKQLNTSKKEFSDPLVNLLSDKFKLIISKDCRSFDKQKSAEIVSLVAQNYDISFNPNNKKQIEITFDEFAQASGIFAFNQCRLDKGIFKTKKDYTDNLRYAFNEVGISPSVGMDPRIIFAANVIKSYINNDCSNFDDPNEQVGLIILKYFEQQ